MDILPVFCDIDDFCQFFEPAWQQRLLAAQPRQRHRPSTLCLSEVMTIIVLFHSSGYRNFKTYYTALSPPSTTYTLSWSGPDTTPTFCWGRAALRRLIDNGWAFAAATAQEDVDRHGQDIRLRPARSLFGASARGGVLHSLPCLKIIFATEPLLQWALTGPTRSRRNQLGKT